MIFVYTLHGYLLRSGDCTNHRFYRKQVLRLMALNYLKKLFSINTEPGNGLLLPSEQFRTLILHECARCDRNAHSFSLIHIDLRYNGREKDQSRDRTIEQLSKSLVKRLRTTDEIGWLDQNSIGVFLPETEKSGAQSLADDVCQGFSYQIYTYPWLGGLPSDFHGLNTRRGRKDRQNIKPGYTDKEVVAGQESQAGFYPESMTAEKTVVDGSEIGAGPL